MPNDNMMLNDGLDSSLASHWKAADEADDEFIPKPKTDDPKRKPKYNPKRKPKGKPTRKPKDKPTPAPKDESPTPVSQADPAPAAPAPNPYYEEDIYGVSDDEQEENTDETVPTSISGSYVFGTATVSEYSGESSSGDDLPPRRRRSI